MTSKSNSLERRGGRRTLPYAFSEQGVAMLSSVLRSSRAIAVNIAIMRAFVRLRAMVADNAQLAGKLDELERRVAHHEPGRSVCFSRQRRASCGVTWDRITKR